jgi:hypothetical protein
MDQGSRMLGFVVIMVLYATIGVMAAAGAIFTTQKIFRPKSEQVFYGMLLIVIAALYQAFVAYFGAAAAWPLETKALLVFAAIGLVGVRLPIALVVGYVLHGLWDLLHELQAHSAHSAFEPAWMTPVPLAYGVFCLTIDFCVAAYAQRRRAVWDAAWTSQRK